MKESTAYGLWGFMLVGTGGIVIGAMLGAWKGALIAASLEAIVMGIAFVHHAAQRQLEGK